MVDELGFFVWPGCSGVLPSPGDGESGARARLAFRTPSVATSVWQIVLESRFTENLHPWRRGPR
jgi:hypothetical protein